MGCTTVVYCDLLGGAVWDALGTVVYYVHV